MDGSEPERAQEASHDYDQARAGDDAQAQADRASNGLRGQIAALRRQVREAQDALRGHEPRKDEIRTFKR
ncbi:MAG: hypothetical protein E7812_10245 [Phenylobacterium sp.]|nr:MAG: hypothetical protein E7812_10245 [Phenylobacterium sp.]